MPQGRILLKDISNSKRMAALKSDGARLLYTWLIPHLDINGCYYADPKIIKGKILTQLNKSPKKIQQYLEDLASQCSLILYEVNGERYLYNPDFVKKQPQLYPDKEAKATIPLPTPDLLQTNAGNTLLKVKESKVKETKVKFKPPILQEIKDYIFENPELSSIDAYDFWKGYEDGGWIDTRGNPVRNWKLKLRTRSKYATGNQDSKIPQREIRRNPSLKFDARDAEGEAVNNE